MGHRLVAAAYAFVGEFNERARRDGKRALDPLEVALLALMAHSARDSDATPGYFASRSTTCAQLGVADTEPGRKRVQRAVRALVEAGAITKAENVHRGITPHHSLIYQGGAVVSTFGDAESRTQEHPLPAQKVDITARPSEPEGGHQSAGKWTPEHRKVDITAPPYRKTRSTSARVPAHTRARDRPSCERDGHRLDATGTTCTRGGCEYRNRDRIDELLTIGRTA